MRSVMRKPLTMLVIEAKRAELITSDHALDDHVRLLGQADRRGQQDTRTGQDAGRER